ncbi:MAG: sensor histidine kinase, partial [Myxococcota bacterium]
LTNASDASAPGQPIVIAARQRGTRTVELDVTDRGDGIPEAVAQRIFEPFFTTKGPGAGTGLGLAVSEGIIRAHGGRLEVYSERGEGTTMRVVLRRPVEEVAS